MCRDVTDLCKAKFLSEVGKKTQVFGRWSTVTGESGFADTARDPRGFSIKFYTEEGNWDMVGNNTPVFFVRDAMKFPDLIHSQKRNPQTHMKDPNAFWDFLSLVPESLHQVMTSSTCRCHLRLNMYKNCSNLCSNSMNSMGSRILFVTGVWKAIENRHHLQRNFSFTTLYRKFRMVPESLH
jgi:hypothetical protein